MWQHPKTDISGEKLGPICTFGDVDRMFNHEESADDYIMNILQAPAEDEYKEFNETFDENKIRAKQAMVEREKKKTAASEKRKTNKKVKLDKMILDLQLLINERFSEAALKRRDLPSAKANRASVRFDFPFIQGLMEPYLISPSKIRKSTLKAIADKINAKLQMIHERHFLNLEFLSANDPFEAALKRNFSDDLLDFDSVGSRFRQMHWRDDNMFFDLLENNKVTAALAELYDDRDFSCILLPADVEDEEQLLLLERLASTVWQRKLRD